MTRLKDEQVAESLDAPPELLPYLDELLRDLDSLGGIAEEVLLALRAAQLPCGAQTRVLDLGSGKGHIALAVAYALDVSVEGVDGFAPFVTEANQRAEHRGLGERVRFREGDIRQVVAGVDRPYDAVMLVSVGPVFGDAYETVAGLRRTVGSGGLMLIDDGYAVRGAQPESQEVGREETLAGLTAHGDELVYEKLCSVDEVDAMNEAFIGRIAARAQSLAREHPEDRGIILDYVQRQRAAATEFSGTIQPALWVLRRGNE